MMVAPAQLYFQEKKKVAFNGSKRNKYESWQFPTTYEANGVKYTIEHGMKYVHVMRCNKRRVNKARFIARFGDRYYKKVSAFLSLQDWTAGVVNCIQNNISVTRYEWYGDRFKMLCWVKNPNLYHIQVFTTEKA